MQSKAKKKKKKKKYFKFIIKIKKTFYYEIFLN